MKDIVLQLLCCFSCCPDPMQVILQLGLELQKLCPLQFTFLHLFGPYPHARYAMKKRENRISISLFYSNYFIIFKTYYNLFGWEPLSIQLCTHYVFPERSCTSQGIFRFYYLISNFLQYHIIRFFQVIYTLVSLCVLPLYMNVRNP